jgi:transcription elongation factor Elf1
VNVGQKEKSGMAWDPQQLEALYANVYRRRMECPACGGALGLSAAADGDAYAIGVVECRACDERHLVAGQNDPLRNTFRPYTEQEKRELFAADRSRRTPVCPVDGTEMDVQLQRSLGRTSNAVMRCRRCAQKTEYARTQG